ncbi:hypothetical protein [Streptomyces litchfieldiae]|uniref:Polymerase nucleotidyl transferase domain-containing protein n=1 Tax=Streptomyces litchfieldiae TaxID=3075543 RepID=A0ABU2MW82_9ACTN|nr:hypothetical protein [Streptomyces sp. DSM 44938]MDT0345760.1 hypothetical protein [Streptomyces sp. DSM 44938]
MQPSPRWRELQQERLAEAARVLGGIPGVHGLLLGGSLGRGEPWPMSDIDLLPVYDGDPAAVAARVEERRAELVDWWAASGRAQTLDIGRLAFIADEAREAVGSGPGWAVRRLLADPRWFHGLDKAYRGRAVVAADGLAGEFAGWIEATRFTPAVVAARVGRWCELAAEACQRARAARESGELAEATYQVREAARALRHVALEGWGERLGSMGREWTRFERMADAHGRRDLADRIARAAGADPESAARREPLAPGWLRERIELYWAARQAVGEKVTPRQNARDQLAAFAVHIARRRPDLAGPWTGSPDPRLAERLADLDALRAELG